MNRLHLTIKRPGSLLSKLLDIDITERTYRQVVRLVTEPDRYMLVERPRIGFADPRDRDSDARS